MSFNQYFADEKRYLYELGEEFSKRNPKLAPYLSNKVNDPDVARLIEGVAFLTGKIRQKLDDDLPEITQSLLNLIWPNYLRPTPAMSILRFDPNHRGLKSKQIVTQGANVDSIPVRGSHCHFKTCYDVSLFPIVIEDVSVSAHAIGSQLKVNFDLLPGASFAEIDCDVLRLFLHNEAKDDRNIAQNLYLWLFTYLDYIEIQPRIRGKQQKENSIRLPVNCLKPVGFNSDEALLPTEQQSFSGYRLLQEYFQLPEKFMFIDLVNIGEYVNAESIKEYSKIESFTVNFQFKQLFTQGFNVSRDNIQLYCTPIVNLFANDADPISVVDRQIDYLVRPHHDDLSHIEIFSVDKVSGTQVNSNKTVSYPSFESFEHDIASVTGEGSAFYKLSQQPSVLGEGMDNHLTFVYPSNEIAKLSAKTLGIELTCTNRSLPNELNIGDVCLDNGESPQFDFTNITPVTWALKPPIQKGAHWRLIANLALHYHQLNSLEALRVLIFYYNFKAFENIPEQRRNLEMAEGIESIEVGSEDRLIKGQMRRGIKTTLAMRESRFSGGTNQGQADMYLFSSVLNGLFDQYADINTFHRLEVKAIESGEVYHWDIT